MPHEQIILEDIETLGLKPDRFTFTSDSFELLLKLCEQLIRAGKAYCDDTDGETMKKEREERVDSRHRNNSTYAAQCQLPLNEHSLLPKQKH